MITDGSASPPASPSKLKLKKLGSTLDAESPSRLLSPERSRLDLSPLPHLKDEYAYNTDLWNAISRNNAALNKEVDGLSNGIGRIIEQHEYDFLQAYNIFVKRKETELKQFIDDLSKKHEKENSL